MYSLAWDTRPFEQPTNVGELKRLFPNLQTTHTGGGCTALSITYPNDNELLITTCQDPSEPEDIDTFVAIGFYDDEGYNVVPPFVPGKGEEGFDRQWHYLQEISTEKAAEYIHKWEEYLRSVNYDIPEDEERI